IKIKHTIIKNILFTGIFGFLSFIEAENCLIYNCGQHNAQLAFGGSYDFNHVTLANYNTFIRHQDPILHLGNFALNPQGLFVADLDATFTNCIIYGYGDQDEEIAMDDTIASFDYKFENCFLKTQMDISGANFIATVKNVDPEFVMTSEDDYHLEATSPCIEAGKSTLVTDDLEETPRDVIKPDIGAYEYIPE
ncbi:MAG: hypothetical protein IIA88_04490, partial [Bacteroidetes bacterium]|nr:hypothetical protein [Bacteroidota bacterium]